MDSKTMNSELQVETDNFDTSEVSKPSECTSHTEINQINTTIDTKPTESEPQIAINKYETANRSETIESDLQILKNTNSIKGTSLSNSNGIVVQNSMHLTSLLKLNRSIVTRSGNSIDTKKFDTERTESVYHSEISQTDAMIDSKPMNSELQVETINFDTAVVSTSECTSQTENNQIDTTVDTKPTESELQIAINKYETANRSETTESDLQILKNTNPIKSKSLLNSNRIVVQNSMHLRSLLKSQSRSIAKRSDNSIDTNKSNTERTESVYHFETSQTDAMIDSKPMNSELQVETNNFDTAVISTPSECTSQTEINQTDTTLDSKPIKLEMHIEKNGYGTIFLKPTEIMSQNMETNQTDIGIGLKPTESDLAIGLNKSDGLIVKKSNPIKGKSLLNSRKNVVKSSMKLRSLLKLNRNNTQSIVSQIDTKKSDTISTQLTQSASQTEISHTGTALNSTPRKTEIQMESTNTVTAIVLKPSTILGQMESKQTHTTMNSKPTTSKMQQIETKKSDSAVFIKPMEIEMQIETDKSDTMQCTKSVELDMEKERNKSDPTEFRKPEEFNMEENTNRFDTIQCIKSVELNMQKEKNMSDITQCTQPIELDIQKEINKSDTAECTEPVKLNMQKETNESENAVLIRLTELDMQKEVHKSGIAEYTKPVELDKQKETIKSDTKECTKPVETDIQKETSKTDTTECTKPVEVDTQLEISKTDITECTKPVEGDMLKETSKTDTTECTKPVEILDMKETSKSDTTEFIKPVEVDIQQETSKSDTTECTEPVEVDIQLETSKTDTTECTKPVEEDMLKETSKTDTIECTKPVEVDIQKETSKSDTTECKKPVDVDIQKETSKTDATECSKLMEEDIQNENKNSDSVIFKIPQVPVRKNIRKLNSDIAMCSKSTVSQNVINSSEKILFKKPKRPVNRTNKKRKMWKDSASTKLADNQIVTEKSDIIKFNQRNNSKYSADTFIKKKLLKRKQLNFDKNLTACSKKPKLTLSYSPIICNESLECDNQKINSSEFEEISSGKDDCSLDCTSPMKECIDMPQFTETQINEQFIEQNFETNEISTDPTTECDILWSTGEDLEIIKQSTETITVDSDTDSNYSVSSFYDEIVEQKLFIERPEGYPRIRVRTDLMPKSPNEAKQICGITLLRNSAQDKYFCAVLNVEEFKKKYGDRNLKLLLKKPNFRMDLHRVYTKISKMIAEGTYTLDDLKEYLIENVDKVMSDFEIYVSLKKKHKEFYESELEATKELAAELEIQRRIQKKKRERIKIIADIKKKSWCRVCLKEATIHCASAKYYCSVNCQNQDRTYSVGTELSAGSNMARSGIKRNMEGRGEVSPGKLDNRGQHMQSSNSELKIAEVWSLNDQEEQEVVAASETGRIAVLKRRNYRNRTKKELASKVTRKRDIRSKSNDVFSGSGAKNVPTTSYKDPPMLNIKRVCPSPNVNPLKKMRCNLKDISKLNTPNNKLNLGKVNKVTSLTEGTVNVPALIIDFPKNKPSNSTTMTKSPQNLLLSTIQKQDGQLKNTPLRLYNFQNNSKVTMPKLIFNNFKQPQNKNINRNSQILQLAQPKSTTQHLHLRPNNLKQNLLMANMLKTGGDTGLNKQYNNNRINTNVNNKNIPTKSLLLCKKTDIPSTSGIHRIVPAQDLDKPGPSGLNTKSARNTTNTVKYPTKPTNTPIKNPTKLKNTFIRNPIKPTGTPNIRYPIKPTSTPPNIRYPTKPTNISNKFPRKPILSLPTTTQPILQVPTNYATNIRMPRPMINNFNVTNPRKMLYHCNPRPMRPRFLFPKPARPDNLKQNPIMKTPPMVKTFLPTPNISRQSPCINNNNNPTRINHAATVPNITPNNVSDIPISVSPTFNNNNNAAQSLPNLAKTLIVAKDNTYKLAVPSVRQDNTSKPVYIIKDLPQQIEF